MSRFINRKFPNMASQLFSYCQSTPDGLFCWDPQCVFRTGCYWETNINLKIISKIIKIVHRKIHWIKCKIILMMLVVELCLTLLGPHGPPGSIHGNLWARILKWVAIAFSRRSSQPWASCIAGRFFTIWASWSQVKMILSYNKIKTIST